MSDTGGSFVYGAMISQTMRSAIQQLVQRLISFLDLSDSVPGSVSRSRTGAIFYRPLTKLREGNAFSRVCLSVHP